jgi:hypothetical protein
VHHTGALVQRRQVGVHVAGVAAAARDLLAGAADLAQRFAVVGHVGEDDQHVALELEREMLGLYVSDHPLFGTERVLERFTRASMTAQTIALYESLLDETGRFRLA